MATAQYRNERIGRYFTRGEFACKGRGCCMGAAPVSEILVKALDTLRERVGGPLRVNSGFRCIRHNRRVGSSDKSQHPRGTAADIALPAGYTVEQFKRLAETVPAFGAGGIGIYHWGLHLDIVPDEDGTPRRWDDRK